MNRPMILVQVVLGIGLLLVVLAGITSNELFRNLGGVVVGMSLIVFVVVWFSRR